MVQIKPVTYTNQNEYQRGEGRPAGAVVYVTGFFICPGNEKILKKVQEKSSVLSIESCSKGVGEKFRVTAKVASLFSNTISYDGIFDVTLTAPVMASEVMPYYSGVPHKKEVALPTLASLIPLTTGMEYPPVNGDSEHRILTPMGQNPFPGETPEDPLSRQKSIRMEESI